jgi:hypothetical protein
VTGLVRQNNIFSFDIRVVTMMKTRGQMTKFINSNVCRWQWISEETTNSMKFMIDKPHIHVHVCNDVLHSHDIIVLQLNILVTRIQFNNEILQVYLFILVLHGYAIHNGPFTMYLLWTHCLEALTDCCNHRADCL